MRLSAELPDSGPTTLLLFPPSRDEYQTRGDPRTASGAELSLLSVRSSLMLSLYVSDLVWGQGEGATDFILRGDHMTAEKIGVRSGVCYGVCWSRARMSMEFSAAPLNPQHPARGDLGPQGLEHSKISPQGHE
jgi:hypothetical protein